MKKAHALGSGHDVEKVASQAVEVHKLLIFSNDKYCNRLLAIDKAHVLCKTKKVRKIKGKKES